MNRFLITLNGHTLFHWRPSFEEVAMMILVVFIGSLILTDQIKERDKKP